MLAEVNQFSRQDPGKLRDSEEEMRVAACRGV